MWATSRCGRPCRSRLKQGTRSRCCGGAKNDQRTATLKVHGIAVELAGGGYDGFRWLSVPVPAGVTGAAYEITLEKSAHGKAAFVAALRLTDK